VTEVSSGSPATPNEAQRPLRVVFTMPLGERYGGSETFLWTFLRHLDRSRVQPLVVFLQDGGLVDEIAGLGVPTQVLDAGRMRNIARLAVVIYRLARVLRRFGPDLVVSWDAQPHIYSAPAAIISGAAPRLMWWQHAVPQAPSLLAPATVTSLATALPARSIGASSWTSARGQGQFRPRRRMVVVHPGIEAPAAAPPQRLDAARRRLGIEPSRRVVGVVGRLQGWKGQHRVLEAVSELRRQGVDAHALVVGGTVYDAPPDYERALRAMAIRPDLRGAVSFTGQVRDVSVYLGLMDALVNASTREPFGIVLIEAMALGVPVIAGNDGGPAEIVEDGRSGLLVDLDDGDRQLVAALARLFADRSLSARLGDGGRRRFLTHFGAERMAERLTGELELVARS